MQTGSPSIITTTYLSNGKEVKVHAIQTGQISVKTNFLNRKGKGIFSKVNILFDRKFADFMPIWAWVIEHPEGVFVIDTGDIEEADHIDFYKHENFISKFNLLAMANKRKITKDDEINNQLTKININPGEVSKVILTHLHGDHTDGLKFFPTNEILVNELEYQHPYGNLPTTYPKWFKPTLFNFTKNRIDVFDKGYPITKGEDLWLVPTQGHTHNHCSVLFKTDNEHLLFAGDTSYNQQQLTDNVFAGSNIDIKQSQDTYKMIKSYAAKYPVIYLPSHDHYSGQRLQDRGIFTAF
ncbi:MAG: N-acyl homoserine lactonase family protein [Bacteroidetes bacterium]|nr:N-acyl homoserine lactonase family protein [Bacteroidota bacterium]